MAEGGHSAAYCRYEEASAYVATIEDPRLKAFVAFGLSTVLTRRNLAGASPLPSFDLLFFAQALHAMFVENTTIRLIVEGRQDEMRWWDDDETP